MKKTRASIHTLIAYLMIPVFICCLLMTTLPVAKAETVKVYGPNLVANDGSMDNILAEGERERTLNADWGQSYPVATFGGEAADSPAKVKNIDGNNVLVLEFTTGGFASFFADVYTDGEKLPAGTYRIGMDLLPLGDGFQTDNVGYNLFNQYSDIKIYENGWKNCTELENGWLHYEVELAINADSVDSIQMWFNTMSSSVLYIDNLSVCAVTEQEVPETPIAPETPNVPEMPEETNPSVNHVYGNGTLEGILAEGEAERTLNGDWGQSYPIATFGGTVNPDSPAKLRVVEGNTVIVLEKSTGDFSSFFADLYADGEQLPAGEYVLSMDLKPVGESFNTDNIGFNLYSEYNDVRIYDNGWKNCTEGENGWYHYSRRFTISDGKVDSLQMWFNTMGLSAEECALYIDNISIKRADNPQTGDDHAVLLYCGIALAALCGVCAILPRTKAHF